MKLHRTPKTFIFFLLLMPAVLLAGGKHEYYVSLTEIRYNDSTSCFQFSLRTFPDDMDAALKSNFGIQSSLLTSFEDERSDSLLIIYLNKSLGVFADDSSINLKFIGKESEADAMWIYLESEPLELPVELKIRSTLLMDEYPGQVNIIQVYLGDWNKGLLLDRHRIIASLELPAK